MAPSLRGHLNSQGNRHCVPKSLSGETAAIGPPIRERGDSRHPEGEAEPHHPARVARPPGPCSFANRRPSWFVLFNDRAGQFCSR